MATAPRFETKEQLDAYLEALRGLPGKVNEMLDTPVGMAEQMLPPLALRPDVGGILRGERIVTPESKERFGELRDENLERTTKALRGMSEYDPLNPEISDEMLEQAFDLMPIGATTRIFRGRKGKGKDVAVPDAEPTMPKRRETPVRVEPELPTSGDAPAELPPPELPNQPLVRDPAIDALRQADEARLADELMDLDIKKQLLDEFDDTQYNVVVKPNKGDPWEPLGEGPFKTEADARRFAEDEVGATWRLTSPGDGKRVLEGRKLEPPKISPEDIDMDDPWRSSREFDERIRLENPEAWKATTFDPPDRSSIDEIANKVDALRKDSDLVRERDLPGPPAIENPAVSLTPIKHSEFPEGYYKTPEDDFWIAVDDGRASLFTANDDLISDFASVGDAQRVIGEMRAARSDDQISSLREMEPSGGGSGSMVAPDGTPFMSGGIVHETFKDTLDMYGKPTTVSNRSNMGDTVDLINRENIKSWDELDEVINRIDQAGGRSGTYGEGANLLFDNGFDFPPAPIPKDPVTAQLNAGTYGIKEQAETIDALRGQNPTYTKADTAYNPKIDAVPKGSSTLTAVAKKLEAEAQEALGGQIGTMTGKGFRMTDSEVETVAKNMASEIKEALRQDPKAAEWYFENLAEAHGVVAKKHPKIQSDPNHRMLFDFATAITSNGAPVAQNAKNALKMYESFVDGGKFSHGDIGFGKEAGAIRGHFDLANDLIDDMGLDGFREFLSKEFTVRELKDAGFKVSGENMDTKLHGSVIFGPKIGGGFYQNLAGNFDPLTFDRWWTRSFGRHTGRLFGNPEALIKNRANFVDLLKPGTITAAERTQIRKLGYSLPELRKKKNADMVDELAGKLYNAFSGGGFKSRTPLNNASRNLTTKIKPREAPLGGGERAAMRQTVLRSQEMLREQGIDIPNAAYQALEWYFEKQLLGKMGVRPPGGANDYAAAFKELMK